MTTGVTDRLIDTARGVTSATVSDEALTVARHCLLDWLGCTMAGAGEPLVEMLAAELAGSAPAESTAIGARPPYRLRARDAALLNGAASHAHDYDDTHLLMSGHPSAPVVPAALAIAERDDRDAFDLLLAVIAGIEVETRLGAVMNPWHYETGWHATGTMGCFGAMAAVGHLLGLDGSQWRHAFGLAASQAAGLKSNFGTMAKPFHAGKAATDGLLAAALAARGFTANPAVVEARQGFFATQAPGADELPGHRLDRHDGRWCIRDTLFKFHAACYLTHSSIEGALALRAEGLQPGAVERVEIAVAPTSLDVCGIPEPVTGLEAKFSLRGTAAMALLGDDMSDGASYTDARITEAEVVDLGNRIDIVPTPGVTGTRSPVVATDRGGRRFEACVDVGRPATDLDVQFARLAAKFTGLAAPVVGQDAAMEILALVEHLGPGTPVRRLTSLAGSAR